MEMQKLEKIVKKEAVEGIKQALKIIRKGKEAIDKAAPGIRNALKPAYDLAELTLGEMNDQDRKNILKLYEKFNATSDLRQLDALIKTTGYDLGNTLEPNDKIIVLERIYAYQSRREESKNKPYQKN